VGGYNFRRETKVKIIEGLKQIKDLMRKQEDLVRKIGNHSAYLDYETPVYKDQKRQVDEWIQSQRDVLKEILRLRIAIQRTNLLTKVEIVLYGAPVTKTIAEWIHRRRDLAPLEMQAWRHLTDKNLKEGKLPQSSGDAIDVRIVRCYDPVVKDTAVNALASEPSTIDSKLEVVNAITDLIEG